MKSLACTLLILLIHATSNAAIERVSYYFQENSVQLTRSSLEKIQEFKFNTMLAYEIQIIEMNSFASGVNTGVISKARIDYLVNFLSLNDQPIDYKVYGEKRIQLNFEAESWDRVDVYYYRPEEQLSTIAAVVPKSKELPALSSQEQQPFETGHAHVKPERMPALSNYAVLPIMFEGGKWTILDKSLKYVEALKETLVQNPELHVHIRGHVCCGNNKRISRNRARSVYKYLLSEGISRKRISFKGYGNTIPLAFPELNAHDRSMNRRVDVVFSTDEEMESTTAQNSIP